MDHTKSKQLKQGSDCIRKYGYFTMENRLYKILKLNLNFDLIVYEIGYLSKFIGSKHFKYNILFMTSDLYCFNIQLSYLDIH